MHTKSYAFYILSTLFFFLNIIKFNLLLPNSPPFPLLFPTLHSIPIAPINTDSDVPPAEINGIGIPVGGIEPVNTSYCTINFSKKKEQIYCSLIYFFKVSATQSLYS